jgi:hypothetical protein
MVGAASNAAEPAAPVSSERRRSDSIGKSIMSEPFLK